jgi:hypothetical protein
VGGTAAKSDPTSRARHRNAKTRADLMEVKLLSLDCGGTGPVIRSGDEQRRRPGAYSLWWGTVNRASRSVVSEMCVDADGWTGSGPR